MKNEGDSKIGLIDLAKHIQESKLTFNNSFRLFERISMASRNLAERTRVEYLNDLIQLRTFLGKEGIPGPREAILAYLQSYLAYLDEKGNSGTTRRRKTSTLKSFFNFLAQQGLIDMNPAIRLIPPETEYKEPRFLSTNEYQTLLRSCSHHPRDSAIIELLLQTGMRLSEVARLSIYDIELPKKINRDPINSGVVLVHGKGRKNRRLPLNYKAYGAIRNWLRIRPKISEPALFVTKFRKAIGPRAIQRLVRKYLTEAGISTASVHTLRHTFATQHLVKGSKLKRVQVALGHADLKTTSIYSHLAREKLRRNLHDHAS